MKALARIVDGAVTAQAEAEAWSACGVRVEDGEMGARARFEGIVRRGEPQGPSGISRPLEALDYEAYEPMAARALQSLAESMSERHGLHAFILLHSRGRVRVGEASLVALACAAHRAPALSAVAECIDLLKRDVPIWKHAVWADSGQQQLG
jgi:molybdopterin synthase catalytic subunit